MNYAVMLLNRHEREHTLTANELELRMAEMSGLEAQATDDIIHRHRLLAKALRRAVDALLASEASR